MKNELIVHIAELDQKEYSKEDVIFEISNWINENNNPFKDLQNYDKLIVKDIIYEKVINIISWEHPSTILDQFEKEDIDEIFQELNIIKMKLEKTIAENLAEIRKSNKINMFDRNSVIKLLVDNYSGNAALYLLENKKEYSKFLKMSENFK